MGKGGWQAGGVSLWLCDHYAKSIAFLACLFFFEKCKSYCDHSVVVVVGVVVGVVVVGVPTQVKVCVIIHFVALLLDLEV